MSIRLTERQRDVLELICSGHRSKQIASRLGISEKTVEVHRYNAMRAMGVTTIAQAAILWTHQRAQNQTDTDDTSETDAEIAHLKAMLFEALYHLRSDPQASAFKTRAMDALTAQIRGQ